MSFERLLNDISVDSAYRHIERITTDIPSRLAGSANSRRMAEYANDALRASGLESRMHEFAGLVSFPEPASVRVLQPETRDLDAHTLGHSASTDGMEGDLVYVGSGAESEYEGKDVRGKITLSELSYSPARHEKAYIAWKRGSSAQIMMNWGDETNEAIPFGSMKSVWGNPTPETLEHEMPNLPCVGIARTEGLRLKALCAAGSVRVWLRAKADNGWKPLTMTTAESSTEPGRRFLLLGGHMDSWFGPQATDNAAGDAAIFELSRVFHKHREALRRGLVAGLWMGHETGTMVSSSRFADLNWDRLRHDCIAYLQIDQPAMTGSSVWHLRSTDDLQAYAVNAAREMSGGMPVHWGRLQKNGDSSFFGVGLPSMAGEMSFTDEQIKRTALATLGWWHHSIHNTIDKIDKNLLALHLRVYARWLWDLLTEPVLPFEYTPIATRFAARLDELAALNVPGIDMKSAAERAQQFVTLAQRLDALAGTWRRRARAGADTDPAVEVLNDVMTRLSRVLVPVASTVAGAYGHDRYGHAWQTQMVPTLVPYPMLGRYDPDSEAFRVWWVAMIRARNRVVDTLDAAAELARGAVERLGD